MRQSDRRPRSSTYIWHELITLATVPTLRLASRGVEARRNVCITCGVIDELVPLEKWDRDDVKASLAAQTITEERRAVWCKRVAYCRRMYPPEKVRRSVELDCYEGAATEVHQSIDRVETVEHTRFPRTRGGIKKRRDRVETVK